jgi:hypothetical protein
MRFWLTFFTLGVAAAIAAADVTVDYTVDAGGNNQEPLNGLAARATYSISGNQLSILLENTSLGVPNSFDSADQLLVSLGFNLPQGVDIFSGDTAVIGPGSRGLGSWSNRVAGDSVAEEWLWTNDFGGDLMEAWKHVISTSEGQGGGQSFLFGGGQGNVDGPYGGIAYDPPWRNIPDRQPAVATGILYGLTLTGTLTEEQLRAVAEGGIVEFGSDQRYLIFPEPSTVLLLAAAGLVCMRRLR